MGRADAGLLIVVGALATFVGVQVARRPHPIHQRASVAASSDALSDDPVPSTPAPAQPVPAASPASRAETPTVHDSRRDVPGTYFAAMVADQKGTVVRWPDRREQGLRIWVQTSSDVHDWDLRYAQMARDAFDDWGEAGLPLRFDFILDSASADIHIVWLEGFTPEEGLRVGKTVRQSDSTGWLRSAQISVAIHDSTGHTIPPSALVGIVRHEAGHALGLGHSPDPRTAMYPIETTPEITAADRATLKLLYEFPPGPVR